MARFSLAVLLTFSIAVTASAQRQPSLAVRSAPIPCRQHSFAIPFEVRPNGSADPIKEVELMVSRNRGGEWHTVGRKPAEAKKFDYTAEQDGEFWFTFRTITLSGATKQSGGGPTIRVLVDATVPALTLDMKQQESGELLVIWKAEDKNVQGRRPDFAVASSVVEASSPTETEKKWKPLNVDGKYFQQTKTGAEGRFLFWPNNGVTRLDLRATLTDIAGNHSEKIVSASIKPVQRDEETRQRDALMLETRGGGESSKPLQPPKPVRMTKVPKETPSITQDETQQPFAVPGPVADTVERTAESSTEPRTELLKRLPPTNEGDEDKAAEAPLKQAAFDPGKIVPVSPAAVHQKTAQPKVADQSRPTPPRPGQITGITMTSANATPGVATTNVPQRSQIIVKWHCGDAPWHDAQIDVMRSTDTAGPWFPVATNLPNSGEYWWYLSAEDLKPFYIMVQMRSLHGGVHVDARQPRDQPDALAHSFVEGLAVLRKEDDSRVVQGL